MLPNTHCLSLMINNMNSLNKTFSFQYMVRAVAPIFDFLNTFPKRNSDL